MHAIAALLAAQHLDDLIREADDERRLALLRSNRPAAAGPVRRLGRLVSSLFGRERARPATATRTPQVTV